MRRTCAQLTRAPVSSLPYLDVRNHKRAQARSVCTSVAFMSDTTRPHAHGGGVFTRKFRSAHWRRLSALNNSVSTHVAFSSLCSLSPRRPCLPLAPPPCRAARYYLGRDWRERWKQRRRGFYRTPSDTLQFSASHASVRVRPRVCARVRARVRGDAHIRRLASQPYSKLLREPVLTNLYQLSFVLFFFSSSPFYIPATAYKA